jgi:uncharacterized membrane protein
METKKTSTGLDENVAAVLCYVVWWITGIIFLLLEENKVVRFHAMQSIIVFGAVTVVAAILGFGPLFFPYFGWIVWGIGIALWIVLMVKAYQGGKYKLPVAGDLAEKWAESQPNPPQPPAAK